MKVRCIYNNGRVLLDPTIGLGYSKSFLFDFEIGQEFIVYGISILDNSWSYLLVIKENDFPSWLPSELFEVIDHLMPPIFYSDIRIRECCNNAKNIRAIFGYKEIVFDKKYYDNLVEINREELDIFYRRKAEIDEFEEMRGMKK